MAKDLHPGLGSGVLREALRQATETLRVYTAMIPDQRIELEIKQYDALLSLSSPIERCTCFERADGIGPMLHGVHDSQCPMRPSQASSEVREAERIAQEMCALATEKHHSADGYAYEKLGRYGKQILDALAPRSRREMIWNWPTWLCWLLTRHRMSVGYADYNVDVRGKRCHCGSNWKDE